MLKRVTAVLKIKKAAPNVDIKKDTSLGGVGHTPFGSNSNGTSSDVSKANIPQNENGVNTLDAENSAAKAQQRKPGTVSAEQMYGVKLSQENKNEDFAEWAEKEDAEKVTNGQQIEENASYSRKIDNIESLSEGGYIPVGRVLKGSALNNIGLASTNIYFDKSKIVKSLDEHSDHITKEVLKQIPQILNEPMVITEANADNTVNVFGNVYVGSSPLMVGVMVTKSRDGKTEINKIRTVHARRDAGKKITDSSVLYLNPNIEKTQTWFQALGNDVPLGGTKFGFIRRITDKLKKVNSENQAAKGTELKIKKESNSARDTRAITPYGDNEIDSSGDVPSPDANIQQNGNAVNSKKQANFEKAAQKKAPGVFTPGAFVQLLKVKELFLAFHFCIALAAINRTILSGFERNFCFAAAGSAGGGVHFFLGFDFVFACIAALFAALGLVNEAALCIEFLFAGGESELFSAFFAH